LRTRCRAAARQEKSDDDEKLFSHKDEIRAGGSKRNFKGSIREMIYRDASGFAGDASEETRDESEGMKKRLFKSG
jgi:hypothetical protein